jgi:glycine/D-amino acid oxidase-like deaminating enzyme
MRSKPGILVTAVVFAALAWVVLLPACGDGRRRVYPVTGQILIDDGPQPRPAAKAFVSFHAVDDPDPRVVRPFAQADDDGRFAASTYVTGDGLPAGEYVVTFTWPEPSGLFKQDWEGKDRLRGLYNDPKTSRFRVRVEPRPNELTPFKLALKSK